MIYLDNASTTLKKPLSVYFAVNKAMLKYNANAGRSGHSLSVKAGFEIYKARQEIAELFNASAENVIFTSGCTESLNLAIRGTVKQGGHIITSAYEHNSVLRVLKHLENEGKISFTIISPKKSGYFDLKDFEKAIKQNTYAIVVNHISNVLGIEQDIKGLGEIAKRHNLLFIVDTAQSAGHKNIDMQKLNISMLAFAGHKGLLGLSGVGGLVVNDKVQLQPIKFGGTGTSSEDINQPTTLPEAFESGTLPLVNIVSLRAGTNFVKKHFKKINSKIDYLTKYLIDNLTKMEHIILYTPQNSINGVVAFNVKNYSAGQVCDMLNEKYKICVRSGLTCAPYVHRFLGTINGGVIRVSIAHYNKKHQIDKLLSALKTLKE
ncbi:MAG: aminotransferase class V-fold PLP-dependent enzyme [Clostridia bacterium]|nr:aminotransferase class V-fold PLP-dependent enzyme [Clostridia bacterium]